MPSGFPEQRHEKEYANISLLGTLEFKNVQVQVEKLLNWTKKTLNKYEYLLKFSQEQKVNSDQYSFWNIIFVVSF